VKNEHIAFKDIGDLSVLDGMDIDKVIFTIGSSDHHTINKYATMGLDYNLMPLKRALFYFQNRGLKKFICFSTILLYDQNRVKVPVDENQPINPYVNDYIFSKFLLEETAKFYSSKMPIITVRLTNIYGPTVLLRPDVITDKIQVRPEVITNLIQQVLSPYEATVNNTKPIRDFLFTYDGADVVMKLLDSDYTGILNVASGTGTSIGKVVEIIEGISGKKIRVLNQPATGHLKYVSDITKLKQVTGWEPKYSIEEGIKATYERMKGWAEEFGWWKK
jgi:dTDP-glucose 4,6-dehydratase